MQSYPYQMFASRYEFNGSTQQARELPVELYKTFTWDRSAEMTSSLIFSGISIKSPQFIPKVQNSSL
jgi:hypothetical protein